MVQEIERRKLNLDNFVSYIFKKLSSFFSFINFKTANVCFLLPITRNSCANSMTKPVNWF